MDELLPQLLLNVSTTSSSDDDDNVVLLLISYGYKVSISMIPGRMYLLLVILLTIYHFFLLYCLQCFALDNNKYSSKFFRIINEVPTILLIITIFLVVFKPL